MKKRIDKKKSKESWTENWKKIFFRQHKQNQNLDLWLFMVSELLQYFGTDYRLVEHRNLKLLLCNLFI